MHFALVTGEHNLDTISTAHRLSVFFSTTVLFRPVATRGELTSSSMTSMTAIHGAQTGTDARINRGTILTLFSRHKPGVNTLCVCMYCIFRVQLCLIYSNENLYSRVGNGKKEHEKN
jgi:hypothetical protein